MSKIRKTKLDLPDYFISDSYFVNLEFSQSGVEINCITHSLFWASQFIPEKKSDIIRTGNIYKYILTEDSEKKHINRITAFLRKNKSLKDKIIIRTLYDSHNNPIKKINGITIPMSNDIVIYRQRKSVDAEYDFKMGIIGTRVDKVYHPNNHSLKIEDDRAKDILSWFDEIWKLLEPKKRGTGKKQSAKKK